MKRTILPAILLSIWSLMATAQVSYQVKVISNPETKYVIVGDFGNRRIRPDSIPLDNGTATVKGNKPAQTIMYVIDPTPSGNLLGFFVVDGSEMCLNLLTGELTGGSKLNDHFVSLIRQMPLGALGVKNQEWRQMMRKALAENRDNVIGAFALSELMDGMSYDELKKEVESGAPFLDLPMAEQAKLHLKVLEIRGPGRMFTDLEEADTLGLNHRLSEYVGRGNYVLVDFWASWCGPCMAEMPNVKENYEKYKDKGFNVVGLSFDSDAGRWKKAIRERGLNWVQLSDLKYWDSIAAKTYLIRAIPSNILCDPDGRIIAMDLRADKLSEKLREIYGF